MCSVTCHVQLFATLWTVACQAPLSTKFSRQKYWSELSCPPPEDLPDSGIETASPSHPALQADSLPNEPPGKSKLTILQYKVKLKKKIIQFMLYIFYHTQSSKDMTLQKINHLRKWSLKYNDHLIQVCPEFSGFSTEKSRSWENPHSMVNHVRLSIHPELFKCTE